MPLETSLTGLSEACRAVHEAQDGLDAAVLAARSAGATWMQIGVATAMSRQAAHERWGHLARGGCQRASCDCPSHAAEGCPCGHGPGRGRRAAVSLDAPRTTTAS